MSQLYGENVEGINPIAFTLASTAHGMMIVPINDWKPLPDFKVELGVGMQILRNSGYDLDSLPIMMQILEQRRATHGNDVVMLDGGANIGCFTVSLARYMRDWGHVFAFEPQQRIYYALAGNLALNNVTNAQAMWVALGDHDGTIQFAHPDFTQPGNYGGLDAANKWDIGQKIDKYATVRLRTIDSLQLPRLDFLKLDLEGMEMEALAGAKDTIERCKPFMRVEHIKTGWLKLKDFFEGISYTTAVCGVDIYAAHGNNDLVTHLNRLRDAYTGMARETKDQEVPE